jgi:outer membrane protein assembly factor BamD
MPRLLIALAALALVSACASTGGGPVVDDDFRAPGLNPDQGESIPAVRFYYTAEENWQEAEIQFSKKRYLAAQQYYAYIRTKFPYSRFAVLSDLRIADCQFEREHWIEAIDSYQNFARLHPTHEQVPYALFRTGMAHYEQIPGSWFLLPPSHEKDQTAVKDAATALGMYLDRYPKDEHVPEAKKAYEEVRDRLMSHERYVADFYRKLGHFRGYVMRLETMKAKFADVALEADLLYELARAYARLGEVDQTQAVMVEMAEQFPDAPELKYADRLVEEAARARELLVAEAEDDADLDADAPLRANDPLIELGF